MIGDVPLSEVSWETWWMLVSAGALLVGLVGRQLVNMVVGAKTIVENKDGAAKFSSLEEEVLADRYANQPFKRQVANRALSTTLGKIFFYLLMAGIVTHAGFWAYAVLVLNRQ